MTEATSEQLLEALLNLERARQHEHNMRVEAEALLEGVRAINSVQRSGDLFQSLADVLRTIIDLMKQSYFNRIMTMPSSHWPPVRQNYNIRFGKQENSSTRF